MEYDKKNIAEFLKVNVNDISKYSSVQFDKYGGLMYVNFTRKYFNKTKRVDKFIKHEEYKVWLRIKKIKKIWKNKLDNTS